MVKHTGYRSLFKCVHGHFCFIDSKKRNIPVGVEAPRVDGMLAMTKRSHGAGMFWYRTQIPGSYGAALGLFLAWYAL